MDVPTVLHNGRTLLISGPEQRQRASIMTEPQRCSRALELFIFDRGVTSFIFFCLCAHFSKSCSQFSRGANEIVKRAHKILIKLRAASILSDLSISCSRFTKWGQTKSKTSAGTRKQIRSDHAVSPSDGGSFCSHWSGAQRDLCQSGRTVRQRFVLQVQNNPSWWIPPVCIPPQTLYNLNTWNQTDSWTCQCDFSLHLILHTCWIIHWYFQVVYWEFWL